MLPGEQVKDVKFQESWYSLPAKVLKGMEIFRYTFNITVTGLLRSWGGRLGVHKMDVIKMLAELRQERDQLEEAIMTLERLARGRGRRRGRPPAWMTELKRRGRPPGSKNKAKISNAA